ncbi:hypothetical protein FD754_017713, partial [Muntiacus muntjak]
WNSTYIGKEETVLNPRILLSGLKQHKAFLLHLQLWSSPSAESPGSTGGAGSLPWTGGSAAKPGKPKGKKKLSSPQNPLSGAQQFVAKDPQDDDDLKLCPHKMMLPTQGQLEGRMIVTAYEHGLDNNHLKDILTSVVSRRKAYRLHDGHFKYAFGSNVTPQPYLKNSVVAYNSLIETSHPPPDDAEQQAALLLACSGDTLPVSLPPVHREVIPTHSIYALNIERIIMKLWHPNHEQLQQDKVHRQRLAAKEGLLFC